MKISFSPIKTVCWQQRAGDWLTSHWFLYQFLNELRYSVSKNKIIKRIIPKLKLFTWQQCINLTLFPWEYVLMQVVFCCFYPACFFLNGSILWQDTSITEGFLFFNVARQVIIYLGNMRSWNSRQRKCFCCFVPVQRWIQTWSAILLSAVLSLNETPPNAGIYFSV